MNGSRIAARPTLAPKSPIRSWDGWPDDVRETVRKWNQQGKLSFLYVRPPIVYFGIPAFKCGRCGVATRLRQPVSVWSAQGVKWRGGGSDTVERGVLLCDPCVIAKAKGAAEPLLVGDSPVSRGKEAEALHRALRAMPERSHLGHVHPSGEPFEYRPSLCPGCAFSIIRWMFNERRDDR